jgi:hypothetical protein
LGTGVLSCICRYMAYTEHNLRLPGSILIPVTSHSIPERKPHTWPKH